MTTKEAVAQRIIDLCAALNRLQYAECKKQKSRCSIGQKAV